MPRANFHRDGVGPACGQGFRSIQRREMIRCRDVPGIQAGLHCSGLQQCRKPSDAGPQRHEAGTVDTRLGLRDGRRKFSANRQQPCVDGAPPACRVTLSVCRRRGARMVFMFNRDFELCCLAPLVQVCAARWRPVGREAPSVAGCGAGNRAGGVSTGFRRIAALPSALTVPQKTTGALDRLGADAARHSVCQSLLPVVFTQRDGSGRSSAMASVPVWTGELLPEQMFCADGAPRGSGLIRLDELRQGSHPTLFAHFINTTGSDFFDYTQGYDFILPPAAPSTQDKAKISQAPCAARPCMLHGVSDTAEPSCPHESGRSVLPSTSLTASALRADTIADLK